MKEQAFRTLFKKYVEGTCSEQEANDFFDCIESGEYDFLLQRLMAVELPGFGEDDEQLSDHQRTRMAATYKKLAGRIRREKLPRPALGHFLRAAVVVVGVLLSILALDYFGATHVTAKTRYAERKEITLPDGSVVTLNANSHVRYEPDWDDSGDREVWLTGEGYFSVVHKENNQRFVVHSKDIDIEVLGTEFNVNNRRGKNQVVLTDGKVKIKLDAPANAHKEIDMVPGDLLEINKEGNVKLEQVSTELFTSWKSKMLIFRDKQLQEVVNFIEDNYGYKVTFVDKSLLSTRFTAKIPSNELSVLLEALSVSYNLDYMEVQDGVIVFNDFN